MADLIDRDAVLHDVSTECSNAHEAKYYEAQVALTRAKRIIRDAPAVNRWIPCRERLPEVGIPVLIYDKHHKSFFVAKLDEDYFGFTSNIWHHPADVPFWMPLPEPPEKE